MRPRLVIGWVAAAVAVALVVFFVPRRVAHDRLPEPAYLPEAARAALHARMERHGGDERDLAEAVIRLDYERAAVAAHRIDEEPRIARPLTGGADELNAQLPERFFTLQDELRAATRAVGDAAAARDPDRLADASSRLARTCVACHELYLAGH